MGPWQLELLREATRGACPACGGSTGIEQLAEGEKVRMITLGPADFEIHEECVGKPIRLPDGTVLH